MDRFGDDALDPRDRAAAGPPGAPPKVPLALALGVTGHRPDLIGGEGGRIEAAACRAVRRSCAPRSTASPPATRLVRAAAPRMHLVTPLAEGADQLAARVALARGWAIEALLPFARDAYVQDFAEGAPRDGFNALLASARSVLELAGERARRSPLI
jgi:hypothetical protein